MSKPRVSRMQKIGIGAGGFLVIAVGLLLIPLPGPGTLIVASGLGMLRKQYPWAGRILNRLPANLPGFRRAIKNRGPGADSE